MTSQDQQTTPPSDASGVGVVLPGDNRSRVPNTTATPFHWVGGLRTWWRDGSVSNGTATLIDDSHVLTCAHNLYDQDLQWCRKVEFRPALNRTATGVLFEPWVLAVANAAVPADYLSQPPPAPPVGGVRQRDITEYLSDYGVARLAKIVPNQLLNTEFVVQTTDGCAGQLGRINGYSGDLDASACTQYTRDGTLLVDQVDEFVTYQMSTFNGDSGAAVYWHRPGTLYESVVAVHVSGVQPSGPGNNGLNFGPALSPDEIHRLIDRSDGDNRFE